MTITNEFLANLRKLAEAATPGPWHVDKYSSYIWGPKEEMVADSNVKEIDNAVARIRGVGGRLPIDDNMAFIGASHPQTVLALLNHIDHLTLKVRLNLMSNTPANLTGQKVPEHICESWRTLATSLTNRALELEEYFGAALNQEETEVWIKEIEDLRQASRRWQKRADVGVWPKIGDTR